MMNVNPNNDHRPDFRGKLHLFMLIGGFLVLLLLCGIVSLFLIEIEDVLYVNGKITSEFTCDMVSHMEGRITKLHVHAGDDVLRGDLLAELDSTNYERELLNVQMAIRNLEAEREVKKAELAVLKSNPLPEELWNTATTLKESRDRLDLASSRLTRLEGLRQKNAVSQHEIESVKIEHIEATAALARAEANLKMIRSGLAEKTIEKAKRDVEAVEAQIASQRKMLAFVERCIQDCRLYAPVSGRIVELPCQYTMYAGKGKVLAIIAAGALRGMAYVPEAQIRKVKPGQQVRISSEVFSRLEYGIFPGEVERVYDTPVDDPKTGQAKYPVRITIHPGGRPLKLGSNAKYQIVAGYEPVLYSFFGFTQEEK